MTKFYVPFGFPPGDLPDGRVLEPGTFVELTKAQAEEPHTARLIAESRLLAAPEKPPETPRAPSGSARSEEGGSR
jgi:hypothetical protein